MVGVNVKFLLAFPLDVDFAGSAEDVEQSGLADFGLHHFGGERNGGEQPGEDAFRFGMAKLLLLDVLLRGGDHGP